MFLVVQEFFSTKLGNGSTFQYWLDDWAAKDILHDFLCLFSLASNPLATLGAFRDDMWNPILDGTSSNQRLEE